MPRAFVTGLSGFTGPYLKAALTAAGHAVCGPDPGGGLDLREPASIGKTFKEAKRDYVAHLAAITSVTPDDAAALYAVNTVGSSNLQQAVAQHAPKVQNVLLVSTAGVYGNAVADPISEDVPPQPVNHYGCSKLAMAFMARTWAGRVPLLELENIDVERDFADVRLLADACVRPPDSEFAGAAVNTCTGIERSLRWTFDELEAITGHRPRLRVAEPLVRRAEVRRLVGSNARPCSMIGPLKFTDSSQTLRWMERSHEGA